MHNTKAIWMLTGGNGAGKSTFYQAYLKDKGVPFINADVIASQIYPNNPEQYSYNAAKIAEEMRRSLLTEGRSFCFETVFSHPSKVDFIAKAKTFNYSINLVFIHLDNIQLNKIRVAGRVADGGHNVPEEKIETRIPRTLEHIKAAIPLCNYVIILDNSSAESPFSPVITINNGKVTKHLSPLPNWATKLLNS